MNEYMLSQITLIASEFLVLISFILTFYIVSLHPRAGLNRFIGFILFIIAFNNLTAVLLFQQTDADVTKILYALIASLLPATIPALSLASVRIIKPEWVQKNRGWLFIMSIGWFCLPVAITLIDVFLGTSFYFTGNDNAVPAAGVMPRFLSLVQGPLSFPIFLLSFILTPILTLGFLIYSSKFDRTISSQIRALARLLLTAYTLGVILHWLSGALISNEISYFLANAFDIAAFAYIGFRRMIYDQRIRSGRLVPRLISLSLIITVPLFIFIAYTVTNQAQKVLQENAGKRLEETTLATSDSISRWLETNVSTLHYLVSIPQIQSMQADLQVPYLELLAENYPYMNLVSTTDLNGINIARSDQAPLQDYSNQQWFQIARDGAPFAIQTQARSSSEERALVIATPIYNKQNEIVGVGMFASQLTETTSQITARNIGESGFTFIVDAENQIVAHPLLMSRRLETGDFSNDPGVRLLRQGQSGLVTYEDENGIPWSAYLTELANGWGVITQQKRSELNGSVSYFQQISVSVILIGTLLLTSLTWASMGQAFKPIQSLTEIASTIAKGDLSLFAPVESDDEFGKLAQAFNSMTAQLRSLINNLEHRVDDRTRDLERRTIHLKAATEVGHAVASIRDMEKLLPLITHLISERFNFYHVGIFLLDENGQYAVLRASNSAGGQRMLARGHRIAVGQGIVGYVTSARKPRIALSVDLDSLHYINPDLPDTMSEMALPLIVGDEILGALDIQSVEKNAFSEIDIETLQSLADQVAIAILNARLLEQTRQLLEAERRAYGQISEKAWSEYLRSQQEIGFSRTGDGLFTLAHDDASHLSGQLVNEIAHSGNGLSDALLVPIEVRGHKIGLIRLMKNEQEKAWTEDEIDTIQKIAQQLGMALEGARLFGDTRRRAERERMTAQIITSIRATNDPDSILQTALQELRKALGAKKAQIFLDTPQENPISRDYENTDGSQLASREKAQP